MRSEGITINVCGDLYIDPQLDRKDFFSDEIIALFSNTDFNIVNLESPVTTGQEKKIVKTGPHLKGSSDIPYYLKQINANLVTLANNHIMDYGAGGLLSTISLCNENTIGYVGAGNSPEEAGKSFHFEKQNIKTSIINFTENEWSVARNNRPGANPMNIIENVRSIRKAKESSDFVIVIIHGGHEFYSLPSPRMVSQYRFYAENGASVIICHHSHCISGFEEYKGVPIFYGIGNFLFTEKCEIDSWYTGLVIRLHLTKSMGPDWEVIPVRQNRETYLLSILKEEERQKVISGFDTFSEVISDELLLLKKWEAFVEEMSGEIMDVFSPVQFFNSRRLSSALRKTGAGRLFTRKAHFKQILNYIRCESHYDLAKNIISKFIEK